MPLIPRWKSQQGPALQDVSWCLYFGKQLYQGEFEDCSVHRIWDVCLALAGRWRLDCFSAWGYVLCSSLELFLAKPSPCLQRPSYSDFVESSRLPQTWAWNSVCNPSCPNLGEGLSPPESSVTVSIYIESLPLWLLLTHLTSLLDTVLPLPFRPSFWLPL